MGISTQAIPSPFPPPEALPRSPPVPGLWPSQSPIFGWFSDVSESPWPSDDLMRFAATIDGKQD